MLVRAVLKNLVTYHASEGRARYAFDCVRFYKKNGDIRAQATNGTTLVDVLIDENPSRKDGCKRDEILIHRTVLRDALKEMHPRWDWIAFTEKGIGIVNKEMQDLFLQQEEEREWPPLDSPLWQYVLHGDYADFPVKFHLKGEYLWQFMKRYRKSGEEYWTLLFDATASEPLCGVRWGFNEGAPDLQFYTRLTCEVSIQSNKVTKFQEHFEKGGPFAIYIDPFKLRTVMDLIKLFCPNADTVTISPVLKFEYENAVELYNGTLAFSGPLLVSDQHFSWNLVRAVVMPLNPELVDANAKKILEIARLI